MKRTVFEGLASAVDARRPAALLTRLVDGAQALVVEERCHGDLVLPESELREVARMLMTGRSGMLSAQEGVFVRSFPPPLRLVVVGAVHLAQFLCPMAATAGFEVIVIDPRRAFATAERFPGVVLINDWPDDVFGRIGIDASTAVAVLTHDPKIDDPALAAALVSPAFYIGALGSARTHAQRIDRLNALGRGDQLQRLRAPIGLPLGGRAPSEIAVAILAQIIQERHAP